MGLWIAMAYEWIKAGHVIFVIFWMAGLFMLPRFFVYHQEAAIGSSEDSAWVERERRLLRIILNPAMIVTWGLGLVLALQSGAFVQIWFLLKLCAVLGLSGYHGWMAGYARKLSRGERPLAGKALRLINEVPGIAAAIIVVLVIVKPFS
jgi:protoporphyrinogen IX oxidase